MSPAPETRESAFVWQLRRALDESAASLPAANVERLAAARRIAIARKKAEPVMVRVAVPAFAAGANAMAPAPRRRSPLSRLALAWPLAALVVGLVAIAYWEDQQHSAELADIDAAMLSDDLPLTAYLDHGFNAYLSRTH